MSTPAFVPKSRGETLDYTVEVDDWLVTGRELVDATVHIEDASNAESPFALQFNSSPAIAINTSAQTSPALNDRMTVGLLGGTPGVTYTLKFSFTDNSVGNPFPRIGVKYVKIFVTYDVSALVVVENGSVNPNANSYVTIYEADAYFAARGDTTWMNAEYPQKEVALVKAADYLTQKYRLRWMGSRVSILQPMDWPRNGVPVSDFFDPFYTNVNVPYNFQNTYYIPVNTIPVEVKKAQFLLARATMDDNGSSSADLSPDVQRPIKSATVGPISVEYASTADVPQAQQLTTTYWEAEQTIKIFLQATNWYGSVVRA